MEPIFPFPFKPYSIQERFMKELYYTINKCGLGIFESPTGTGKSLSICCGTLHWLKQKETKLVETLETEITQLKLEISSSVKKHEDWLQEEYEKIKKNQELCMMIDKLDKIKKRLQYYEDMQVRVSNQKLNRIQKSALAYIKNIPKSCDELENQDILQDFNFEDNDLLLEECNKVYANVSDDEDNKEDNFEESTKIYISSRTHSQLSQFVGEIKRTVFKDNTRVVTLASRQHYCINSEVSKLKNTNLINERCLDMQKSSTKGTSVGEEGKVLKKTKTKSCTACPYYNQSNIKNLRERLLVDIMDMEDLVKNGKELKACPYYASRMALEDAQVVLISHAGIVSPGARSGVSLKLDNNVLILDEAHGLTTALENAHSAPVSAKQISSVKTFLQFYINKYQSRLSCKNLLSLNQMNFVIGKLHGILMGQTKNSSNDVDTTILTREDFVIKAEIDHMNLRPLVDFCRASRLAPKLHGFSMRYSQQTLEDEMKKSDSKTKTSFELFIKGLSKKKIGEQVTDNVESEVTMNNNQVPTETSAGGGLYAILDFLDMLCDRSDNGRVLIHTGVENGLLKYLLLNPAEHFTEVVRQCRSVILAGGTMEPIQEFQALLTGNDLNAHNRITVLRCDHVVPADNVLGICLSKGPSNISLNFSYENRQSKQLLDEVGRILRNICNIVPGGVICFLPSYSYEQTIFEHLKGSQVIEVISKKKQIFREPKSAADVDKVLHKFSMSVNHKDNGNTGALLFSVVGGKLSEGLNFSDNLGRCVIVIGMPYPNIKSPELQEKISYINRTMDGNAGNIYYENLCMKAVNQCIGRAVRHANDYACVLLVDERYSRPQTAAALPTFVQKSLKSSCNFGPAIGSIGKFFGRHKNKK